MPQNLVIISRHESRVVNELILQTETHEDKDEKSFEPPTQQPPIGFSGIEGFKVSSFSLRNYSKYELKEIEAVALQAKGCILFYAIPSTLHAHLQEPRNCKNLVFFGCKFAGGAYG